MLKACAVCGAPFRPRRDNHVFCDHHFRVFEPYNARDWSIPVNGTQSRSLGARWLRGDFDGDDDLKWFVYNLLIGTVEECPKRGAGLAASAILKIAEREGVLG